MILPAPPRPGVSLGSPPPLTTSARVLRLARDPTEVGLALGRRMTRLRRFEGGRQGGHLPLLRPSDRVATRLSGRQTRSVTLIRGFPGSID